MGLWVRYAGRGYVYGARACTWGTTVRAAGRAHACTLSRGAASIASKITITGREAAVEQRSERRRQEHEVRGGRYVGRVSGQVQRMPDAKKVRCGESVRAGVSGRRFGSTDAHDRV